MPKLLRRRLLFFGVNIDLHELVFLLIEILLQIDAEVNRVVQDLLVVFELFVGVFGFKLGQNFLNGLWVRVGLDVQFLQQFL